MDVEYLGVAVPLLEIRVMRIARTAVVELAGEADMNSWASLESLAGTVLDYEDLPDEVLVDVTKLSFCDARSICLIADFCDQVAAAAVPSLMRGKSSRLDRLAALAGARLPADPC